MPRYLIEASYSPEGLQVVRVKGEDAHVDAIERLVDRAGGSMRSFHSPSGEETVVVVVDAPSHEVMAAVACEVTRTGVLSNYPTVLLLAVDQPDEARLSPAR